jgi:hypothetical protein
MRRRPIGFKGTRDVQNPPLEQACPGANAVLDRMMSHQRAAGRRQLRANFAERGLSPEDIELLVGRDDESGEDSDLPDELADIVAQLRERGLSEEEIREHIDEIRRQKKQEAQAALRQIAEDRKRPDFAASFATDTLPPSPERLNSTEKNNQTFREFSTRPGSQHFNAADRKRQIAKAIRHLQRSADGTQNGPRSDATETQLASDVARITGLSHPSDPDFMNFKREVEAIDRELRVFSGGNRPNQRPGYLENDESSTGLSLSLSPAEQKADALVDSIFEHRSNW